MQTRQPLGFAVAALVGALAFFGASMPVSAQTPATVSVVLPTDRTVLPIPEPEYPHSTVLDVRNATPPPRFEVKAPAGAPNVLIVLIDDMGFGQSERLRRARSTCRRWTAWPTRACATTSSTPRRSARRPARRCSPAATTT